MVTIKDLQDRAVALSEQYKVESVTPQEVGGLIKDSLKHIADFEENCQVLGIKKIYTNVSDMNADKEPTSDRGIPLRFGQLVCVSEDSDIYRYNGSGWDFVSKIGELNNIVEINGDVINAADEEDITSDDNNLLKLKDRLPSNGLGFVILRQNKSFKEQVTEANTIYEIRYNFQDIGTVNLKPNCVLKFTGGNLINGTIKGDNATIVNAEYGALDSVVLTGTWKNSYCDLSWWGCVPYDSKAEFDNSDKIQCAMNSVINKITLSYHYGLSRPVRLSSKLLTGGCNLSEGWKKCGFIANSNFAFEDIEIDGKAETVKGMFYHTNATHPNVENLTIQCNYKAGYAFQHMNKYSNLDLKNINIYDASIAGIVQYGCENLKWEELFVSGCRIGAFISDKRINEENPLATDGEKIASNDMIVLDRCRFLHGNYGFIIQKGTNTALYSCETSRNTICAMAFIEANVQMVDYYSERDADGNFYIYPDGRKTYADNEGNETTEKGNEGFGRTHPYLISNNIDGLCSVGRGTFGTPQYIRGTIITIESRINTVGGIIVYSPRSYITVDVQPNDAKRPTERNASGVDCLFVCKGNNAINVTSLVTPTHPNGLASSSSVYSEIINVGNKIETITAQPSDSIITNCSYPIRYVNLQNNGCVQNTLDYKTTNFRDQRKLAVKTGIYVSDISSVKSIDYNVDIEKRVYGGNPRVPLLSNKYRTTYKGFPLFEFQSVNSLQLRLSRQEVLDIFKDAEYVKYRMIAYVTDDIVDNIYVTNRAHTNSWAQLENIYTSTQAGKINLTKGYYDIQGYMRIKPSEPNMEDWAHSIINISITEHEKIYLSPICFYHIEDGEMLAPLFSKVTLDIGATSQRPDKPDLGQEYYDTTIKKKILWDGTTWTNIDGSVLG